MRNVEPAAIVLALMLDDILVTKRTFLDPNFFQLRMKSAHSLKPGPDSATCDFVQVGLATIGLRSPTTLSRLQRF